MAAMDDIDINVIPQEISFDRSSWSDDIDWGELDKLLEANNNNKMMNESIDEYYNNLNVGPAQLSSPLQLDLGEICSKAHDRLREEEQVEMQSSKEPSPENAMSDSSGGKEASMKNEELAAMIQALEASFQKHTEQQFSRISEKLEEQVARLDGRVDQLQSPMAKPQADNGSSSNNGEPIHGYRSAFNSEARDANLILKTMRVKVLRFDGNGVEDWVYKMNKFFELHNVSSEMRLATVAFHLEGAPSTWYQWMEKGGGFPDWETFLRALRSRFGTSIYEDPLGKIAKLVQTGIVANFREEFEQLMTKISGVPEQYFLNYFVWGLKTEIRRELLLAKPTDLADAMTKAQLYEDRQEDIINRTRSDGFKSTWTPRSFPSSTPFPGTASAHLPSKFIIQNPNLPVKSPTPSLPVKKLTPAEIKEKRDKGLCFTCDEKYHVGHKCKNRVLILCAQDEEGIEGLSAEETDSDGSEGVAEEVSLNALSNASNPRIFRIIAKHRAEDLEVLIDMGSNNNFIQEALATRLALPRSETKKFKVYMGNGNSLWCSQIYMGVELSLQGHKFKVDLFVLPIWGLDVVLGMQWLQTLGPCLHDHKALTMEFQWEGKTVKLEGTSSSATQQLSFSQLHTMMRDREVRDIFMLTTISHQEVTKDLSLQQIDNKLPQEAHDILTEFQDIFSEPKSLPPYRSSGHRIFLQPHSQPVNVRPYRYPYFQKDIIERLVREMEDCGFVRPSTSPFSSPVLFVKKKDGSWRFCVDYRALNNITIKDRFPIPTIDELLDELGGATIFSKLDLRAGYHQIRMDPKDVHKTAFRTHEGHYEFLVMPFGLTNAPSTFQATMNRVFQPLQRHCVIVFFDDFLVYSKSTMEHIAHLCSVFQLLRDHRFFAKLSKCTFFQSTIEYLGHLVAADGVRADPSKITAMLDWPQPSTLKQLRGFLGLTGYYRRFVAHYASIAAPLTELLKKENFIWTEAACAAFRQLKQVMTVTPVLALPDFSKLFVIEADASNVAYLRELRAIVEAATKWRQYLLGRQFLIRTDHKSLKELLTQVIQTPEQQQFLQKLIGFHFTIEYKPGKTNAAVDALSRQHEVPNSLLAAAQSTASFEFLEELRQENTTCPELRHIHEQLASGILTDSLYSVRDGLLYHKHHLRLSSHSNLKQKLLSEFHEYLMGGHAGPEHTFLRLSANFMWPGMRKEVQQFVRNCIICQTIKYSPMAPYGLLQPLQLPERVWEDLSMDFIVGLPKSGSVSNILVVVDRFTKYAHFGALSNQYTATKVVELFSNMVIKLHGLPRSIVSDRDPIFTSAFWRKLFELMGTRLKMSSSYHPQTDGQTEVTNRYLEQYLRAFTADNPRQWSRFLPWAEYHYNTSYHSSIEMTPFQAVYGRTPPSIPTYTRGTTSIHAVEEDLLSRDDILKQLTTNLQAARNRMKQQADKHRRDIKFSVGDLVLIKLQPYRQNTVAKRLHPKLCKRYFGPFPIKAQVGQVAYTVELPEGSKIHPTFHVSVLTPFYGPKPPTCYPLPEITVNNKPVMLPQAIVAVRTFRGEKQILVQWSLSALEDATWENLAEFGALYGIPNLEDKVVFNDGGSVGSAQLSSPLQLDLGEICSKSHDRLREEEQVEMQSSKEPSPENAMSDSSGGKEASKIRACGTQARVKPKWLEEFVRLEAITLTKTQENIFYTSDIVPAINVYPYWGQTNNQEPQMETINAFSIPIPATETRTRKVPSKNGRWTIIEHMLFLKGLNKFGYGQWTKICALLGGTRTPAQVSSHAQNYYNKMMKKEDEAGAVTKNNNNNKKMLNKSINDIVLNDDGTISAPNYLLRTLSKYQHIYYQSELATINYDFILYPL
ncbi:uncharacterized protein LOC115696402 [Cannabis sativa]|uniref:uncharacterized protein LOC115696402 n=1 Tax=Cannabis sativa TaxID=3483 RepID=UPI0029C9B92C|nr:uncharacterized protein LOC115696402 [Cannabis sativa]